MNLNDLLDTLRRDILHDRSDQVAGDNDQLWSDTTLIRYIDQAQRRFARRSLCIRDGTSAVTRFQTVAYQQDYALDPSIISVFSARNMGNGAYVAGLYSVGAYNTATPAVFVPGVGAAIYPDAGDLGRTGHAARNRYSPPDTNYWDINNFQTLNPGKPLVFDVDEFNTESGGSAGGVNVRLYPMPDLNNAGCTIQLRVARLPLVRLTAGAKSTLTPEIPEDYHLDMLDYAAYLALRIVDHEEGDPARAGEFLQSFEKHVEEARTEILRKTFAPQTWGFGRNGFSYEGN